VPKDLRTTRTSVAAVLTAGRGRRVVTPGRLRRNSASSRRTVTTGYTPPRRVRAHATLARRSTDLRAIRIPRSNRPQEKASCRQDAGQSAGRPRMPVPPRRADVTGPFDDDELGRRLSCIPSVLSQCLRKDTRCGLRSAKKRRPFSTFLGSGRRGDGGPGRTLKGTARGAMVARRCATGVPYEGNARHRPA
jgi:hypothetical protein